MKRSTFAFSVFLCILFSTSSFSQSDLDKTLSNLTSQAASAYVGPVVSAFGADLNSGWTHRVTPSKILGFDLEVRIVAMGAFFQDQNKTFSTSAPFRFTREQAAQLTESVPNAAARADIENQIINRDFNVLISGPTIVGNKDKYVAVRFAGGTFSYQGQSYTLPAKDVTTPVNGYLGDLSIMPLAAPQITVGTVYGTALSIRALPDIQINNDLGKFSFFGIGIQHNPAVWLTTPIPVDFSVGFFTQNMKVGDIFTSSATMFNINVSKTFGTGLVSVTPYAGIGFESSSITVKYGQVIDTPTGSETVNISVDLNGENSTRFTVGASVKLTSINLNFDYNLSKYNSMSAGLGFLF